MSVAEMERPARRVWWTAEQDAVLLDGKQRGLTYRQIGLQVGKSKGAVNNRWRLLQQGGGRHRWSKAEDGRLIELLERHLSWNEIVAEMGYSRSTCQARAHTLGVSFRTANGYALQAVARLMGVDHHVVARWIRLGLLLVHRTTQRTGRGCYQFADHDDLVAFIETESAWHHWEPERITDLALREWATELRRGLRFLTTTEAAPLLCMTPLGVQVAIRDGRLRAVRRGEVGDRWLIRSDWIREPDRKSLKGQPKAPRHTSEDLALVRRWWGKRPGTWIARQLGRGSDAGVHALARRLGLPRLGRGYWKVRAAKQGVLL